ncbi:hypothetical protein BC830DRAFT_1150187 [Chytriomyces sp. MP71]|nr:hypothetical protein BC830DRAFT_1150187 [Chytriomyces sp. MP71]
METFRDAIHLRLGLSGWTRHQCLLCTSRTRKPTNFTMHCINECFDWHAVHSLSDKEAQEKLDMEQIVSDEYHLAQLHGNLQHVSQREHPPMLTILDYLVSFDPPAFKKVLDAAEEFLFCSYQDSNLRPNDNDWPAPHGEPSDNISKQLTARGHWALKFLHKSGGNNQSNGNWIIFSGLQLSNQVAISFQKGNAAILLQPKPI